MDKAYLVPPADILALYAVSPEQFIEHGYGGVYELLVKRGRLLPNERVLDLGCGPGHHARPLTEYLSSEGSFEGLDIGLSVIEYCKGAYGRHSNFNFTHVNIYNEHYNRSGTIKQNAYKLPFKDADFDLVYSVSLFTHLLPEDATSYFREIRRVLKPTGRLISTFFLLTAESRANIANENKNAAFRFPHDFGSYRVLSTNDPAAGVAYDEAWIRNKLAEAGFRLCEVTYGTWSGDRDMLQALQDTILALPT
jgi:SAM-dependent methyltransferase